MKLGLVSTIGLSLLSTINALFILSGRPGDVIAEQSFAKRALDPDLQNVPNQNGLYCLGYLINSNTAQDVAMYGGKIILEIETRSLSIVSYTSFPDSIQGPSLESSRKLCTLTLLKRLFSIC